MTKEQVKKIEKYEQQFRLAMRSNFCRMSNTEFNEVAALYKEINGTGLTSGQMTCNTCRLRVMKEIGEDFFKSRDEFLMEERGIKKDDNNNNNESEGTETKKKAGRPRKIKLEE